jgi:hypothetical protein
MIELDDDERDYFMVEMRAMACEIATLRAERAERYARAAQTSRLLDEVRTKYKTLNEAALRLAAIDAKNGDELEDVIPDQWIGLTNVTREWLRDLQFAIYAVGSASNFDDREDEL